MEAFRHIALLVQLLWVELKPRLTLVADSKCRGWPFTAVCALNEQRAISEPLVFMADGPLCKFYALQLKAPVTTAI